MATEGTFLDLGGAVYNVSHSTFAAKGDVRFADGAAMTAGSSTLTVPVSTFTSGDVGKIVWVPGAGTGGRTLSHVNASTYVTISAYVSPTQVTLSQSAATSVTGKRIGFGSDDTAALQAAINAAAAAGGGEVLLRGGRTYLMGTLHLRPGVTLNLNGATLLRPANQGKFARMIVAAGATGTAPWSGSTDSAPVTIRNGTIDGNRVNQGPYTSYELEQQHLVFLEGSSATAGRLRANVENLLLRESVADGLSLYNNVDVQVRDVRTLDCWRGGLVATGGYSRVQVVGLTTGGYVHPSGIDVEIDGPGFGGSKWVDMQMTNVRLDGDFELGLEGGGIFVGDNIVSTRQGFAVGALDATVRISNSSFVIGAEGSNIVWPKDVVLDNVTFTMEPAAPNPAAPFTLGLLVRLRAGLAPTNQRCVFRGCRWRVGPSVKPGDVLHALMVGEDALSLNNEIVVEGGEIPAGFDYGIDAQYGMRATITGLRNRASKPIRWVADENDAGIDLTISDMDVRGAGFYMEAGDGYPGTGIKRIEHRNMQIDEEDAGVSSVGGFHVTTYVGGRIIRVNSSPVGRLGGMQGDVAQLKTPVPGQTLRWVCTASATGSGAVWKPEAALGA